MSASPDIVIDAPTLGHCRPIDLLDAWRYAQAEVEIAFREWVLAPLEERGDRHAVYRAALDREEQAAVMLATLTRGPSWRRAAAWRQRACRRLPGSRF
jgi:hypothetical protein